MKLGVFVKECATFSLNVTYVFSEQENNEKRNFKTLCTESAVEDRTARPKVIVCFMLEPDRSEWKKKLSCVGEERKTTRYEVK